ERTVARKPPRCRTPQATAVPLAGLTAYQRLVEALDVQHGERVLVHAAAGGIGQFTVQIAMARGAEIVGTASALHHEALASSA
ncbi:MAG TPA: NADP-dependent oxidoreductase, partial [Nocardioidaceae bacterium]|nr:NADP-dependent oxidoreductase [Nocardioidaceae bacterium]